MLARDDGAAEGARPLPQQLEPVALDGGARVEQLGHYRGRGEGHRRHERRHALGVSAARVGFGVEVGVGIRAGWQLELVGT